MPDQALGRNSLPISPFAGVPLNPTPGRALRLSNTGRHARGQDRPSSKLPSRADHSVRKNGRRVAPAPARSSQAGKPPPAGYSAARVARKLVALAEPSAFSANRSRSLVSGTKSVPITTVMSAITMGYQRP